jgi:hypothetical protein
MVSKPYGGIVGTVKYQGKPATNRVLKQCLEVATTCTRGEWANQTG